MATRQTETLGVLFVHGAGDHEPGDTLRSFGGPVFDWLNRWLLKGASGSPDEPSPVQLVDVDVRPDTDRAHATLRIQSAEGEGRWILAESTWDNVIGLPGFWSILRWAIAVTPWVILTQLWAPVVIRYRTAKREHPDFDYFAALDSRVLFRALLAAILTPIGTIAIAGIATLLTVVSIVPLNPIRAFVQGAQRWVSGFLGDLFTLLRRPMDAAAMTSKIRSDIDWLVGAGATSVAVVAHSQGGALAYLTVRDERRPEVKLLYTFGSGVARLQEAAWLLAQPWAMLAFAFLLALFLGAAWFLVIEPVSACGVDALCVVGAIDWGSFWTYGPVIFGGIGGVFLGARVRALDNVGNRLRWVDALATSDPVLADRTDRLPEGVVLRSVTNFKSPVTDHQSYWDNRDEFVTDVVQELGRLGDLPIVTSEDDAVALAGVSPRRRWRVSWLLLARIVALLATAGGLWAFRAELAGWGDWMLRSIASLVGLLPEWLVGSALDSIPATGTALSSVLGAMPVLLVGVGVYKLLFGTWRQWDASDLARMFGRQPVDSGGFWFAVYLVLCLVVVGIVALAVREGSLNGLLSNVPQAGDVFWGSIMILFLVFLLAGTILKAVERRTHRQASQTAEDLRDRLAWVAQRAGAAGSRVGSGIAAFSARERSWPMPGPYAMGVGLCILAGILAEQLYMARHVAAAGTAWFVFLCFTIVLSVALAAQSQARPPWRVMGVLGFGLAVRGCFS